MANERKTERQNRSAQRLTATIIQYLSNIKRLNNFLKTKDENLKVGTVSINRAEAQEIVKDCTRKIVAHRRNLRSLSDQGISVSESAFHVDIEG